MYQGLKKTSLVEEYTRAMRQHHLYGKDNRAECERLRRKLDDLKVATIMVNQ